MLKNCRGIIIGFIFGIIFAGMLAVAASNVRLTQIWIDTTPLTIEIDGRVISPVDADGNPVQPFISEGTTYLPVRALAGAFGKQVDWDGNTRTIKIFDPRPAVNYFEESFTGPISANWRTINGDYRFDGPNGIAFGFSGAIELIDILPNAKLNFTVEFEASSAGNGGDWRLFGIYLGKNERENLTDFIGVLGSGSRRHLHANNIRSSVSVNINQFYNIKIVVNNQKADIYIDGEYINSDILNGAKSVIAFGNTANGVTHLRNFKLTIDSGNTGAGDNNAGNTDNSSNAVPSDNGYRGYAINKVAASYFSRGIHDVDNGVDIAVPVGTPVYVVADGTISCRQVYTVINGIDTLTSYGNHIRFTSDDGNLTALYAHLDSFADIPLIIPSTQTANQSGNSGRHTLKTYNVKKGDIIGYTGNTGRSTGPHLHFSFVFNGNAPDSTDDYKPYIEHLN